MQDERGIQLDVGVQVPAWLSFAQNFNRDPLDLGGQVE
jgi:hypothetical protein